MTTREQAIRDEAEKSIYQDEDGICRSRFGGLGSTSIEHLRRMTVFRLTEAVATIEAAERVRAATEPPASAEPTRLALRDTEIARLNRVIQEKGAETRRLVAEIRRLNAMLTEQANDLKNRKEQHEVDKQVIEELQGVIEGLREDVDDREEEIERLTKEAEAAKPQASELTKSAEKLDRFRPVTNEEFWLASGKCSTYAEAATSIIRRRVAEALADIVPRAEYEGAVRQLAKGWAWEITSDATGERVARYSQLCKRYGVEPEGGAK